MNSFVVFKIKGNDSKKTNANLLKPFEFFLLVRFFGIIKNRLVRDGQIRKLFTGLILLSFSDLYTLLNEIGLR